MSDLKRRIDCFEKDIGNSRANVVISWDTDPKPPEPGVIVVTWNEEDEQLKQAD